MVICLERGADLHMAQLMPLPLTVSCFSEIQTGFTFLVPAHPGSLGLGAVKRVCVCVCVLTTWILHRLLLLLLRISVLSFSFFVLQLLVCQLPVSRRLLSPHILKCSIITQTVWLLSMQRLTTGVIICRFLHAIHCCQYCRQTS